MTGGSGWSAAPVWAIFRSREEFGGDGQLLSLSATHGIRARAEGEGRAASEDLSGYRRVRPGDIVINKLVAQDGAIAVSTLDGKVSPAYWVLVPDARFDARFLNYLLNSSVVLAEIARRSKFMPPAQFDLSWDQFRTMRLAAPALEQQRAIADYLDAETARIDALIVKKQRMIELIDDRVASTRTQTFVFGDVVTAPLGRFVRSISQGASPQASLWPAAGDEWGLLKLSAVKRGRFVPEENKALPADFPVSDELIPKVGDLLVTRSNTPALVGESCVVADGSHRVVLCDLIYRLRLDDRMLPEYVSQVLLSLPSRHQLSSLARGSSQSMVKLRGEDIKSVQIPIRTRPEQAELVQQFESVASRARQLITALTTQIGLLREHRQALITTAVTGELDLRGVAS